MQKVIKILKAIFSLGFTVYLEFKSKQKQIDSLVVSTQTIFNYMNSIRKRVKDDDMNLRDVFEGIDVVKLKQIANSSQRNYGTAIEIGSRIKELYEKDVLKVIDEIKEIKKGN